MNTSPSDLTLSIQPSSKPTSRRLPPPCWSHDETVALIESYRDKWYSLHRGNLRAPHWQEVADGVSIKCCSLPNNTPCKTSIQCRHKMEKLRKRYRAEVQRIANLPDRPSSWVHFKLMDSMELGLDIVRDETRVEDDLVLYPKGIALPLNRQYPTTFGNGNGNGNGNGVRIKIPSSGTVQVPPLSGLNLYNTNGNGNGNMLFDDYPPSVNLHYRMGKGLRNGYMKEVEKDRNVSGGGSGMKRKTGEIDDDNGSNVMDEMVAAINRLGDGFVKMERMKMDMARELESMRMKMEMKRTEMILDSHQKILDSFSNTVLDKNKKLKRMLSPES